MRRAVRGVLAAHSRLESPRNEPVANRQFQLLIGVPSVSQVAVFDVRRRFLFNFGARGRI